MPSVPVRIPLRECYAGTNRANVGMANFERKNWDLDKALFPIVARPGSHDGGKHREGARGLNDLLLGEGT